MFQIPINDCVYETVRPFSERVVRWCSESAPVVEEAAGRVSQPRQAGKRHPEPGSRQERSPRWGEAPQGFGEAEEQSVRRSCSWGTVRSPGGWAAERGARRAPLGNAVGLGGPQGRAQPSSLETPHPGPRRTCSSESGSASQLDVRGHLGVPLSLWATLSWAVAFRACCWKSCAPEPAELGSRDRGSPDRRRLRLPAHIPAAPTRDSGVQTRALDRLFEPQASLGALGLEMKAQPNAL